MTKGSDYIVKSSIMVISLEKVKTCLIRHPKREPCSAVVPTMAANGPRMPLAPAMR